MCEESSHRYSLPVQVINEGNKSQPGSSWEQITTKTTKVMCVACGDIKTIHQ